MTTKRTKNIQFISLLKMFSSFFGVLCGTLCASDVRNTAVVEKVDQPGDSSSFFLLPEDVLKRQVLPLLQLKDIVCLDSALANHTWRNYFHASLNEAVVDGVVDIRYLNWWRTRKCSAKTLVVASTIDNVSQMVDGLQFEALEVCATARVSEHALSRVLTNVPSIRTLNIQAFWTMRMHQILPLDVDLPLLEINVCGNISLEEDILVSLVKRCPLLRVIDATRCFRFKNKLPLALAEHCSNLQEVRLSAHGRMDEADHEYNSGFCELFQNCRHLQVVYCVGYITVQNMQTLAESCRKLTSVSLHGGFPFEWDETQSILVDAPLVTLVQNNPHIETLKLSYFPPFNDVSLLAVAQYLPDLHTFCLICCQASLTGLAAIRASCTKLTTFEVYRQLCPLTFMSLYSYDYLQLSILTELSIYCTTLSDAQLIVLAQANPKMQKLRFGSSVVANNPSITSNALCEALSHLSSLETFDAGMFFHPQHVGTNFVVPLEDCVLHALVQYCPSLTSVNVSGHLNISNTAMSALANLPLLRFLSFSECANLLDSGVVAIAEKCSLLDNISLSYCPHITNVSIDALARCCRNLTTVILRNCGNISNTAIQNLVHRARHLQVLDFAENPLLTFAAVAELPQYCFYMRYLRFYTPMKKKPLKLEFYAAYRRNRRYFDIVFGWSEELRANISFN